MQKIEKFRKIEKCKNRIIKKCKIQKCKNRNVAIDALSLNLSELQFYAFPPFSVIATLLQKIQEEKATGIVVLPDWPTQSWYAKAMQMCLQPLIRLAPGEKLLTLPG